MINYGLNGTFTKPFGLTRKELKYVVLDYAPNGSLLDLIYKDPERLSEPLARHFFK